MNEEDMTHDLIRLLKDGNDQPEIEIIPEGDTIAQMEANFPMQRGRLDWSEIPGFKCLFRNEQRLSVFALTQFFNEFLADASFIGSDKLKIVGDGIFDNVIRVPASLIVKHLSEILSIPQHTYIIDEEALWCFNHTFEGDAYFGSSTRLPNANRPPRK